MNQKLLYDAPERLLITDNKQNASYRLNKEKYNEKSKRWYYNNIEKGKKAKEKYRKSHTEQIKERDRKWRKTEKGKLCKLKHNDKRKRNLGGNIINDWFSGCNRHHVNKDDIICIPASLHKKFKHSHKKPETMIRINQIAFMYLVYDIKVL